MFHARDFAWLAVTGVLLLLVLAGPASAQPPEEKTNRRTDRYGDPLPEGAILRLGTTRLRHGQDIDELMFSPKGDLLASVAHKSQSVRLWDASTGKQLGEWKDPASIAFSPDGGSLAVGAWDGTIRIRDVDTGRVTQRLSIKPSTLACITYSPDGKRLAVASRDGTFVVWDLASGKEVRRIHHVKASLFQTWRLALTAEGKLLVCGGPDSPEYRFWHPSILLGWDVNTGKAITEGDGPSYEIKFATYALDGGTLFYGGKEVLGAWHTATQESMRTVRQKEPGFLAFALSPDGTLIASASWGGVIQLWDAATFKEVKKFDGAGHRTTALAFSRDGKKLASAEHGVIRLWDTGTGKRLDGLEGQEEGIVSVALAQRSERIISASWRRLRFWDATTAKLLHQHTHAPSVGKQIALSPDERLMAIGDDGMSVWDVGTGKLIYKAPMSNGWVDALGFSDANRVTVAAAKLTDEDSSERWIAQWDIKLAKEVRRVSIKPLEPESWWRHLGFRALSADGKLAVSSDFACPPIYLWDTVSGKVIRQLGGEEIGARAIALSPDGWMLATSGWWSSLQVWEVTSGKERGQFSMGHSNRVTSIAFSPDGRLLGTGDGDGRMRLWDLARGKELKSLPGHDQEVTCLSFSQDGRFLASGSRDTTTLVWDIQSIAKSGLPAIPRSSKNVAALWDELADAEAGKAYRAIWGLVAVPDEAVPLLRKSLRPVARDDARVKQLIADLGSEQFVVRKKATEQLEELGELARPALEELLRDQPDPEVRRRAERLLEETGTPTREQIRQIRAIETLERIDTKEARDLLRGLAGGAAEARLTREAKAAMERLEKRAKK